MLAVDCSDIHSSVKTQLFDKIYGRNLFVDKTAKVNELVISTIWKLETYLYNYFANMSGNRELLTQKTYSINR